MAPRRATAARPRRSQGYGWCRAVIISGAFRLGPPPTARAHEPAEGEPHALIVGGVEPEHPVEDALSVLESTETPETQAESMAPPEWAVVDQAPRQSGAPSQASTCCKPLHARGAHLMSLPQRLVGRQRRFNSLQSLIERSHEPLQGLQYGSTSTPRGGPGGIVGRRSPRRGRCAGTQLGHPSQWAFNQQRGRWGASMTPLAVGSPASSHPPRSQSSCRARTAAPLLRTASDLLGSRATSNVDRSSRSRSIAIMSDDAATSSIRSFPRMTKTWSLRCL